MQRKPAVVSPGNDLEIHYFEFYSPSFSSVGSLANNLLYLKHLCLKDKYEYLRSILTFQW